MTGESVIFAILCTGPSMSQAVADSVRHLRVIAVNDAYKLAPWAEALAANDSGWWHNRPEARQFAGRKFCSMKINGDTERVDPNQVYTHHCSGVLALEVAKVLGAKTIILLGADMHGTHYFGPYTGSLRNTSDLRRREHANQFKTWGKENKGVEVFNCTPGSALTCFPMARLEDAWQRS